MKDLLPHGLLAVGGLLLAYVVWTSEQSAPTRAGVPVIDCTPETVEAIRYESTERLVNLRPRAMGEERGWWIDHEQRPETGPTTSEGFLAGSQVDAYVVGVASLQASRDLGPREGEVLEQLGLKDSKTTWSLRCGERERRFDVGGRAYGSGERYLRDQQSQRIFLVAPMVVRELERPRSMMRREVVTMGFDKVERLEVRAGGEQRSLLQRDGQNPERAYWVDSKTPDRRNELYSNWVARLSKLRATSYLAADESPGASGDEASARAQALATLRFFGSQDVLLDTLELRVVRGPGPDEFFGRGEQIGFWVALLGSSARLVDEDLGAILGGKSAISTGTSGALPVNSGTPPSMSPSL